jgi:UDP-hydrolysing UDP-N-acetyl-D-glucosamine 2-epimerase
MIDRGPGDKRRIAAVTVGRSDYGIYHPVFNAIERDDNLELVVIISGSHLSAAHGLTVKEIEADNRNIGACVEMLLAGDTPLSCAMSMGLGTINFAQAYARIAPDIVLVLGDRFEMHAAAVAAIPMNIPIAHIHGGELTFGAIDDILRHSITKLSHLHFAATEEYGKRIISMGEEPWRVTISGAPSLDKLAARPLPTRSEISQRFGISLDRPPLLVTYHPETRSANATSDDLRELLAALHETRLPVVFSAPNADPGQQAIRDAITAFVASHDEAYFIENFGASFYFGMLAQAVAIVGNSSSALIEAPSFCLPAINIGSRQKGRTRAANLVDVPAERSAISAAISRAISPEFRASLDGLTNPYGDGRASSRIVTVLRDTPCDQRLIAKEFHHASH